MAISLQSYNEILGKLVRKIIADTPVNDLSTGSVLLTLLEAVASQDFENNTSILSVLETLNIDALKNIDLDVRAADYGISRKTSVNASGFIKISDSSITKRATTLYAVKPSPIAGDNKIFVNNAENWGTLDEISGKRSGAVYIGRGTQQFEGPIPYYDIINNGSFYEIKLGTSELSPQSLQKDHLSSDGVVDGQNTTDRLIPSGTVVKIPSNNLTPEIKYITLRDAVIPAGEDYISDIPIIAQQPGSSSNAGLNSITNFDSLPFPTAIITNTSVLSDGKDTESDDDLRERLKNYSATLARGTRAAILAAIVGVSDSTDGKQVSSAVVQESVVYGEPSLVYIDDGSGFEPSTQGQSVDILLASANGGEQFLQLSNSPIPRPQVINQVSGPIELIEGMKLVVAVDGEEQEIIFISSYFNNIASATLIEITAAINDQANKYNYNFRARLTSESSRILLYPTKFDAEFIQVIAELPNGDINANSVLSFSTSRASYISLYKNNTLLRSQETSATLTTLQSPWQDLETPGTLVLSVDGTPSQSATFTTADFNGAPLSSISASQWADVLNLKFAGITATATSNGKIQIKSNKIGSSSSLEVIGGTYLDDWFSGIATTSTGSSSDFLLNRQTGNIKLIAPAETGDSITAGNKDSKGYIVTVPTNTGTYDLTLDAVGRPSEMVVVADGLNVDPRLDISRPVGTGFKVETGITSGMMRVFCQSAGAFQKARVGDYLYIAFKKLEAFPIITEPKWFREVNTGIFKILAKGDHTTAGVDTWVDVANISAYQEPSSGWYSISLEEDIQIFGADAYPQVWKSSYVSSTEPITLKQMTDSFESDLINVKGSLFKTNMDKLTSSTENDGAIAVPVSVGKLSFIIDTAQESQLGNQSHVATRISNNDLLGWFKRGSYTQRTSTNTLLPDRTRYYDVSGQLSANSEPGSDPQYAENLTSSILNSSYVSLDEVLNITSGANKNLFRSVVDLLSGDTAGTRETTPYTSFDYLSSDAIEILKPLSFASDDSIVLVVDGDVVNKTINVNFWRTGRVNSNIPAGTSQFSANDADNESDVDFSSLTVWSTSSPIYTNFEDYAVWFRSRNWYRTGGSLSSDGTLIIRAKEYGPIGDSHRFLIDYPSSSNQLASVVHANNPEYTTTSYYFGSGAERPTGITPNTKFSIYKINTIQTTPQGSGASEVKSGSYFRLPNLTNGVVFYYAVNNDSTPQPSVSPAPDRYVKINTVNTGDSAILVAQKTKTAIDEQDEFKATIDSNNVSYINNFNGTPSGSTSQNDIGFTFNSDTKNCRYTFENPANLEDVLVGDILSVTSSSVVNSNNSGTFSILNVKAEDKYVDIYNPNCVPTVAGRPDKVQVSSITQAGAKLVQSVTTTAQGSGAGLVDNSRYFTLTDQGGVVVFWYNISGSATQPTVSGASRFVAISTVSVGDSANVVAQKTSAAVGSDSSFTTSYTSGSTFTVTNNSIGNYSGGTNGAGLSFIFATSSAGAADTIGGKYFKLYDGINSTVAVWLNVNGNAIPPHGCSRAIQVVLEPGDTASTVASKIALTIDADEQFVSYSSSTTVYISNYSNGERGTAVDGSSPYNTGFTVAVTQTGQGDQFDAPSSNSGVIIYPLTSTDVESIAGIINTSVTLNAAVFGLPTATITKATREELLPVAYSHDIDDGYISLYDGSSIVKYFSNNNPNFVLKTSLILQGQEPSIYDMATCPNPDSEDLGELFKLIPRTIKNVKHHLTHKALSQLPIVADIDIAGNFRKIQIKSKKLGTQGAVEIVGGRANIGELDLSSTSSSVPNDDNTIKYVTFNTQAYPNTFGKGDTVKLYNTLPAKRKFEPDSSVNVEVKNDTLGNVSYLISSRDFNYSPYTKWTISDSSATYGAPSGTVWRWTHNEAGAKASVYGKVQTYNISSITRSSGTATVNTSSNHALLTGQKIVISGVIDVPSFNGEWVVLNPGLNTFEFTSPGTNAVSAGGKVTSVEVQETTVKAYPSSGTTELTQRLRAYDFYAGNTASPFSVNLTVDSTPNHADYFLITGPEFESPGSTPTFAVWFKLDSNTAPPTGTPYTNSTYKIQVAILSSDNVNTIVNKLSDALNADGNFNDYMVSQLKAGTSLIKIMPGDTVNVYPSQGDTYLLSNWPMSNQSQETGSQKVSGFPVLSVNYASRYMDILNPNGKVMSTPTFTSETGNMSISPSIGTRFRLKHKALNSATIVAVGSVATATTSYPHGFSIGDVVLLSDASDSNLNGTKTITSTPSPVKFTFSSTYSGAANCLLNGYTTTRYRISSLGFKDLYKLEKTQGESPKFTDCGAAVDDFIEISGASFNANNRGRFRILALSSDSIIYQNANAVEEITTTTLINYRSLPATWVYGSNQVTGTAGAFKNVSVGSWIKSTDDNDGAFAQVLSLSPSDPSLATTVTLGQGYAGISSTSEGVCSNFDSNTENGIELLSSEDIKIYESDTTTIGDSLVIDSIANNNWFSSVNSGSQTTIDWGADSTTRRQYVTIRNVGGINQSEVNLGLQLNGFYLLESTGSLYETIRIVENTSISSSDFNQRIVYLTPNDRSYKISKDYGTKIASIGKMEFPLSSATGIDGYLYYTGLMRTVQRVIDGYEPDAATYPGRRAVGSTIEVLPPLIKKIEMILKIATKDGVNLNDITNNIKSTIISYISSLGVGQDVVLSEVIRRIKSITGVDAVTFTSPAPSTERISVNDDEKALISPDMISLS